jgi:hypothetical protein
MSENQQNWINWARTFEYWGIKDGVASLLEIGGSLNVLIAQILYLSQPILSGIISPGTLNSIALMLENPGDRREFITFLKEAPIDGTGA